ncbi:Mitochondrial Rho GTPase [Hibiscus syriacus]|uniref:Mitochondrial Rho GTPase n=1 Tax=Hibiscus syriacus TaxID=106335 RepID=A0A6A2XI68_HIBSY|nr:protein FANTASTIC FOUR 2-like [Hibiscus syriacus]KAE8675192.1 Mitochondrial Rho GTPase [Hibiscus syriacus]
MCSSVCQGLQSCQEVVESRFLRLKLVPPQTSFTEPYNGETNTTSTTFIPNDNNNDNDCQLIANRNTSMGGWSFLQSLSDTKPPAVNQKVYVHPPVKRSAASRLSDKSLEMCTEHLGSETGSESRDCGHDISLLSLKTQTVARDIIPSKPRESSSTRKMRRDYSFPPPLTSISCSNGVQVKSHRENGRLILQAVSVSPCHSYFHAERSEGRLRLSLFRDATPVIDIEDQDQEQEDDEEVKVEEDEFYGETENKEGINGNVGGEIGAGKLPRPSSCKESNRSHEGGLLHWKPFLVTT